MKTPKFNYILEEHVMFRDHRGEVARKETRVHLIRANGKKVCACRLKGNDTLSTEIVENEQIPDGAVMCIKSAAEYNEAMNAWKSWHKGEKNE